MVANFEKNVISDGFILNFRKTRRISTIYLKSCEANGQKRWGRGVKVINSSEKRTSRSNFLPNKHSELGFANNNNGALIIMSLPMLILVLDHDVNEDKELHWTSSCGSALPNWSFVPWLFSSWKIKILEHWCSAFHNKSKNHH